MGHSARALANGSIKMITLPRHFSGGGGGGGGVYRAVLAWPWGSFQMLHPKDLPEEPTLPPEPHRTLSRVSRPGDLGSQKQGGSDELLSCEACVFACIYMRICKAGRRK